MITNHMTNRKINLHVPPMYAKTALLDPIYTESVPLCIDGGVSSENAGASTSAGKSCLIAGSAIFNYSSVNPRLCRGA
jgi:pentose-5-phosphate-3-epimerase